MITLDRLKQCPLGSIILCRKGNSQFNHAQIIGVVIKNNKDGVFIRWQKESTVVIDRYNVNCDLHLEILCE